METVIIAAGSNLGDRHAVLRKAGAFLNSISSSTPLKSSIWESEPVGPSKFTFLNSAAKIETDIKPSALLAKLKLFEKEMGRDEKRIRWGPRILDLDIITYSNLVIQQENLIIPHPEYTVRRFVLLPMNEILQDWSDPVTGRPLKDLISGAPEMQIQKTKLSW